MATHEVRYIIFFDGICVTCNRFVDFLLRPDRHGRFLFAPLQGETAKEMLAPEQLKEVSTIILRGPTGDLYRRSDAIYMIAALLPAPWSRLALIRYVPSFLRNAAYVLFSLTRNLWGSPLESCRAASEEERGRLLS